MYAVVLGTRVIYALCFKARNGLFTTIAGRPGGCAQEQAHLPLLLEPKGAVDQHLFEGEPGEQHSAAALANHVLRLNRGTYCRFYPLVCSQYNECALPSLDYVHKLRLL